MFRRFQQVLFSIHFSSSENHNAVGSERMTLLLDLRFADLIQFLRIFVLTSAPMKINILS